MPLFFFISGHLNKHTKLSFSSIKKMIFALVIPYVIYNAFFLVPHLILNNVNFAVIKNICLVHYPINIPTWFFISLFFVKIFAMFCKSKLMYIIISLLCIIALYAQNYLPYPITFGIKGAFTAFPFFTLGYLLKGKSISLKNPIYLLPISITVIFLIILFVQKYGAVGMYNGSCKNILFYYSIGSIVSIFIMHISSRLPLKNNIIKTISRGTMFIVGTHWIITDIFKYFTPNLNAGFSIVLSLLITLLYYFPISLTYIKVPFLYGKIKLEKNISK